MIAVCLVDNTQIKVASGAAWIDFDALGQVLDGLVVLFQPVECKPYVSTCLCMIWV